ncbi:MAG: hypothetical protein ACOYB7_07815 [Mycobacterium sp.]
MPRKRRGAFPAITAALVIPPAVLIAAIANAGTAPVTVTGPTTAAARYVASPSQPEPEAVTRLVAARLPRALPPGLCPEKGLQVHTVLAERVISAHFPEIREMGGVRPDALPFHPNGLAIDVIIPEWNTPAGKALGDRIAAFAFDNAARFGLVNVIWQQTYRPVGAAPHVMANLGSPDANHFTHVHITTDGGGFPTGGESYFG